MNKSNIKSIFTYVANPRQLTKRLVTYSVTIILAIMLIPASYAGPNLPKLTGGGFAEGSLFGGVFHFSTQFSVTAQQLSSDGTAKGMVTAIGIENDTSNQHFDVRCMRVHHNPDFVLLGLQGKTGELLFLDEDGNPVFTGDINPYGTAAIYYSLDDPKYMTIFTGFYSDGEGTPENPDTVEGTCAAIAAIDLDGPVPDFPGDWIDLIQFIGVPITHGNLILHE